jgi:nitrite reductase/ring-hydroxylating ferredoxin subunit
LYAVGRRCGHINAPLEMGTLEGAILTCPVHRAQFDVTSAEALSGPVPPHLGNEPLPPRIGALLKNVGMLMQPVRTESIRTYEAKVESEWVCVGLKMQLPSQSSRTWIVGSRMESATFGDCWAVD